jgi:hypothetical protein
MTGHVFRSEDVLQSVPFAEYLKSRIRERFGIVERSVPNACHSQGVHWNPITCVNMLLSFVS